MQIMMHDVMCMNDICINYGFYEKCMNDICCGISKHIHLEEDVNAPLGDSGFCLGMKRMETPRRNITLIPPLHYLTKS